MITIGSAPAKSGLRVLAYSNTAVDASGQCMSYKIAAGTVSSGGYVVVHVPFQFNGDQSNNNQATFLFRVGPLNTAADPQVQGTYSLGGISAASQNPQGSGCMVLTLLAGTDFNPGVDTYVQVYGAHTNNTVQLRGYLVEAM